MKENELMTGDWVQVKDCIDQSYYFDEYEPGEIVQVREILDNGINPNWAGAEVSGILGLEDIQPIPITPEILEKNGFMQNPRSKSRRSHQICTDSVYISWWRGRLNILFKPFIGHSTNHVNVDGKYVHELQHALRICGIEKEIVL